MCTIFYKHVEHILMRRNTWYMWTMYDAAVRISSALQPHSCSTDHSLTSSSSTNINSKNGRNLNKHVVLHVAFTIQKSYIDTPCILTIWWEKLLLKAFTNATRHQGWHQWSYTDATTSKKVVLLKTIKWEITVGKDNKRFQTTNAFVLYIYIYIPNRYNIIIIKVEIVSASQGQMLTPSFHWLQYAMAAVVGFLWLL